MNLSDWIEGKANGYLAKADGEQVDTDTIRYRHYSQALFLIANEIRAGMHEDEQQETT